MLTTDLQDKSLIVPAFHTTPEINLPFGETKEAEKRIIEAKTVSPVTYADLENCYSAAYRELKSNLAIVGYQKDMAQKAVDEAKSEFFIDYYPKILGDLPKSRDCADLRNAWLMRHVPYRDAMDRFAAMKALEAHIEGKIKVFERVSSYMKKSMDLVIRSGLSGKGLWQK